MARRRPARPSGALHDLPPLLILKKIFILQLCYYTSATILIVFTALVFGRSIIGSQSAAPVSENPHTEPQDATKGTGGLGLVLDWRNVRGDTTWGVVMAGDWLGAGFLAVIPLLLLLPRSRLIPDFAFTIHFLHLLATSLYTHLVPTNLLWWTLQLGSILLMTALGVWGARYREMRPISFGTGLGSSSTIKGKGRASGGVGNDEEEVGLIRDEEMGSQQQHEEDYFGSQRSGRGRPGRGGNSMKGLRIVVGGDDTGTGEEESFEMVSREDGGGGGGAQHPR